MAHKAGDRFASYELVSLAGEGGMGTVWKARDTRLDRTVALKLAKAEFSDRFAREARAVAALNHHNVCHLHDVGPNWLVMEYVEGTPLKGPLPLDKAADYACQILDALAAAHEKGITHRDLKPSNILVTKQGIKLLDFGLAKQSGVFSTEAGNATLTEITREGQIVGTLQYMSPEQLQGKQVDPRSDLFSFGCILYEMLTGRQAFTGDNLASLMAAILEREPAPLNITSPLDRIVRTCLAKDPDQRFQTAVDLKRSLRWALEQPTPVQPAGRRRPWLPVIGVAAAFAAIAGAGGWYVGGGSHTASPAGYPPPIKQLTFDGNSSAPALSPDGKLVAYASSRVDGNTDIYVQQFDGRAPVRLTEDSAVDTNPAFSADGSKIYFDSYRSPNGIYEMSALGGEARLVAAGAFKARPSPQGTYLAYWKAGLWNVDTVPPSRAIVVEGKPAELDVSHAAWTSDRRLYSYAGSASYVTAPGFAPDSTPPRLRKFLMDGSFQYADAMVFLSSGHFLFSAQRGDAFNLWKVPVDDPDVPPVAVTTGVSRSRIRAAAAGNRLVFTQTAGTGALWRLPCDLDSGRVLGQLERITPEGSPAAHPDITPDGAWLVYCGRRLGAQGVLLREMATGKERSVAQPASENRALSHTIISPDGQRILAYQAGPAAEKAQQLVSINVRDGQIKPFGNEFARLRGWVPGGHSALLWTVASVETVDTSTGERTPVLARGEDMFFGEPRLSRDGKWLAFLKITGFSNRLFVAPFAGNRSIPPSEWVPVAENVSQPAWSPDGRSLYYVDQKLGAGGAKTVILRQRLQADRKPEGAPAVFTEITGFAFGNAVGNPVAVGHKEMIFSMSARLTDLWAMELR